MKLTIVGMAGSFPAPSSPTSCYLVQAQDSCGRVWSLVLDLGSGAFGPLQSVVDPFLVDAVAITHLHPDHFADLCGFFVYLKYHPECGSEMGRLQSEKALPVFGPAATADRVGSAYGLSPGECMGKQFDFRTWQPGTTTTVGPFTLEPFAVRHPVPAFGLRLTGPSSVNPGTEATLAYSGDTDICDGVIELAADADLLLAEAAFVEGRDDIPGIHLTGRRAGQVATRARARRLLLTHIPSWNDPEVAVIEAVETFSGPIEVACQGAVYTI